MERPEQGRAQGRAGRGWASTQLEERDATKWAQEASDLSAW